MHPPRILAYVEVYRSYGMPRTTWGENADGTYTFNHTYEAPLNLKAHFVKKSTTAISEESK